MLSREPTKKRKLRSVAEFLGGVGRDVASEVIAKVISQPV